MLQPSSSMPLIAPGEHGLQVHLLNCPYGELATHPPLLDLMDTIARESPPGRCRSAVFDDERRLTMCVQCAPIGGDEARAGSPSPTADLSSRHTASTCSSVITLEKGSARLCSPSSSVTGKSPRRNPNRST